MESAESRELPSNTGRKEILGDHLCLMGAVPSVLLASGGKDKVMDYCKRLNLNRPGSADGLAVSRVSRWQRNGGREPL
jgi:hypothetical protein